MAFSCVYDFLTLIFSFNPLYSILLYGYTTTYSIRLLGISDSLLFFSVDKEKPTAMLTATLVLSAKPGSASELIHELLNFPTLEHHSSFHGRKKIRDIKIIYLSVVRVFILFIFCPFWFSKNNFLLRFIKMRRNGLPAFFREIHIQQRLASAKLFQISKVEVGDVIRAIIENSRSKSKVHLES